MYEFLSNHLDILANVVTLVAPILWGISWSHRSLNKRIDEVIGKIDRIAEEVKDIDRRLCRLEGSLSNKDCCMLKDPRLNEKVE